MMRLYETAMRAYQDFQPGHKVKIYVCGVTPYDAAHLGHIFTFMTYDLLQRRLEDQGHKVQMVRNITDVDEPIYRRAAELGVDYTDLAATEIASFQSVLARLSFRDIHAEPKASEYIEEMAAAVGQLVRDGVGYAIGSDIYFDTAKADHFGAFAGFDDSLLKALFAVRGGDLTLPGKRQPLDFLLWRAVDDPNDSARWRTSLGVGRPGWHIECSVMSAHLLGKNFDLHGGGTDLIFPHHAAEIAQSVALTGQPPAKRWLHVSPLLLAGEKMSKSLGNMVFAKDLLDHHEAATIRLSLMHYHYRIGGEWQPELLVEAERLLQSLSAASKHCSLICAQTLLEEVRTALDDDLNTLEVVDSLHHFVVHSPRDGQATAESIAVFTKTLALLGLTQADGTG